MKIVICILLLIPVTLFAQPQVTDWSAFDQRIDVKAYEGKKFRVQAAVRVDLIDSTAEAEVWVRVDRSDKKRGFFYNMTDKPIRDKNWKVYTIEGEIDKNAEYLAVGGLYFRKGVFFFDNFKVFIERSKNKFEELPLLNGSYENDSITNWSSFKNAQSYVMTLAKSAAYDGAQCLKVDGSNFKKPVKFGDNDSTGKYAAVNGIQLYYETYGAGEPLLLLHGNQQSIEAFTYQIPELSKYYKVIAVDTRGQGKSTEDGKLYTYDLFAADMNGLLDHLQLESVNVIGWSDGGNTGLIMAMKYPKKVKRLVTMGANVFIDQTVVDKKIFAEVEKQIKAGSADTSYKARNRVRLNQMLLTEPQHTFDDLKNIRVPVLVMAGENDIIKEAHTQTIAGNIPKGNLYIEPKASHYFPVDDPKKFNKVVLDFLSH